MANGAHMFMLLFIGTFLCLDLGSIMNLCYLRSLRKLNKSGIMTGRHGLFYSDAFHDSTLQAEPFKLGWGSICRAREVCFIFRLCVGFGKSFWQCCNGVVNFFGLDVRLLWS